MWTCSAPHDATKQDKSVEMPKKVKKKKKRVSRKCNDLSEVMWGVAKILITYTSHSAF